MNPSKNIEASLKWLSTPIQYAKGVGPRLAKLLEKMGVRSFEDMLYHLPFRYMDRRELISIHQVPLGKNQVVMGEVVAAGEVVMGRRGKKIYEVIISDGRGQLSAKYFHYNRSFMKKKFSMGSKFILFGEVGIYHGKKQMVHPEIQSIKEFFDEEDLEEFLGIIPVYSSTEGLAQRQIRKIAQGVVGQIGDFLQESLPREIYEKYSLPNFQESFKNVHYPENGISVSQLQDQNSPYHRRLTFDEFFYLQLGLGLKKQKVQVHQGFKHKPLLELRNKLLHALPFELTPSQIQAVEVIGSRMCQEAPMNVLLQGDVGSGKTLVGMLASLLAVENNYQVALMVPTEILAEQHGKNFRRLLEPLGCRIRVLTASTKEAQRKEILQEMEAGDPLILIGTHALIEEDVSFAKLSLVIIDEQHRFGVRQRMKLMQKAQRPDVLVMTATPIPRSLALTLYGDLDLVLMTELPRGRIPIQTRVMTEKNRPKLYDFIKNKLSEGRQAFFVYPLIEESEKMDLKDAT
ncbi:MAG: ATP-dependent DNA helicase RecG, partial [bacterium]|nr:ATP-dependent DNA helicase RecG [bacterium]